MTMMSTLTGQWAGDTPRLSLSVDSGADGFTCAVAEGALDQETAPLFRAFLETRCSQPERPVCIDLSGVRLCDAEGLGVLIDINARLAQEGDEFFIVNPCPMMRLLIEMLHVDLFVLDYHPLARSQQPMPH